MKKIQFLCVLLLFLSFLACETTSEDPAPDDSNGADTTDTTTAVVFTNENEANATVASEIVLSTENSQFIKMTSKLSVSGNFYVLGKKGSSYFVAEISASGSTIWEQSLSFTPTNLFVLSFYGTQSILGDAILVLGSEGGDGKLELYNRDGNLLSNKTFSNSQGNVSINEAVASSANPNIAFSDINSSTIQTVDENGFEMTGQLFIALGGLNKNGTTYPYLHYFTLSSTGIIQDLPNYMSSNTSYYFSNYPNFAFNQEPIIIGPEGDGTSPGDFGSSCDFSGNKSGMAGIKRFSAYGIDSQENINNFAVSEIQEDFSYSYTVSSCKITAMDVSIIPKINWLKAGNNNSNYDKKITIGDGSFVQIGTSLFLAGMEETENNKATVTDNNFYTAGFLAKFDLSGNLVWQKQINLSNRNDAILGMYPENLSNPNNLYVCGYYSTYTESQNNQTGVLGYGMISKIDLDGNVISSKYFGENTEASSFHNIYVSGSDIFTVGYKGLTSDENTRKAWFAKIASF